jgi:hypothetical protein
MVSTDLSGHPNKGRTGLRSGPGGQLPGSPTYNGHYDVTRIMENMVPANSDFPNIHLYCYSNHNNSG